MSVVPFMRIKATEDEEAGDNIFLLSLSLLESVRAVQCTVYSADLYSWQVSFVSFVLTRPSPGEDLGEGTIGALNKAKACQSYALQIHVGQFHVFTR